MEVKIKEEEKAGTNHYADSRIKRCQVCTIHDSLSSL